jgi:predicted nucleotidyltransferase
MENGKWRKALSKFIEPWEKRKEVVGALVCGSYVTGNPSRHSDIDVQILLDRSVRWRERGNKIIDGFLIEYFANPLPQNLKYYEGDYRDRDRTNSHMFLTGEVLFDKNGDVKTLIEKAKEWEKKEFKRPRKAWIEITKYGLWDLKDNLENVFEDDSDDFYFVYYNYLRELLDRYCDFSAYPRLKKDKARRFLTSESDRKKYRIEDFPDKRFASLFTDALTLKGRDEMLDEYRRITDYVLKAMGGFSIDGWKVRSDVES